MFLFGSKGTLGVDIGTSSIKLVQLKRGKNKAVLETYGIVDVSFSSSPNENFDAITETAAVLKNLVERSRVSTKRAVASLPNNIVFVSLIEMPEMSEKELKSSIQWEARRYVPLPLDEVTLSWSVYREPQGSNAGKTKVLLTAVPTRVVDNYLKMFKLAGLTPIALELEALPLIRSLIGGSHDSFVIIDVGARNTSLNLVDKGFLRLSRNLSVGGESITAGIAQGMRVSFSRAEQFKRDLGLNSELTQQIPQTMRAPIDMIKNETTQLINIYESSGNTLKEIVFTGSGARIPGLLQYFADLGPKVSLGDPLKFVSYNPSVKAALERVGPGLAIAIGLAMRQ